MYIITSFYYSCCFPCFICFVFHLSVAMIMKVCPSWPSSEDRYILREIMLRRTKGINFYHLVLPCS
jgi:hypothetical protein